MIENYKDLLLKDLCCRFPYGVNINVKDDANGLDYDTNLDLVHLAGFGVSESNEMKPYLRPMSSMTEQEKEEYEGFEEDIAVVSTHYYIKYTYLYPFCNDMMDWLNKHHFDYRGLIPAGLALEAKEGMYNT